MRKKYSYAIGGERSEHSAMLVLKKGVVLPHAVDRDHHLHADGIYFGYSAILGLATGIVVSYKYEENRIDKTLIWPPS